MFGRTFHSRTQQLIDRARRSGTARDGEIFFELSEFGEHSVQYRSSRRLSDRFLEHRSDGFLEGISTRSDDSGADPITIDGFTDDPPLIPSLAAGVELQHVGAADTCLPSRREAAALLTELVHDWRLERARSVTVTLRTKLRRTLVLRSDRCIQSLLPFAALRVDVELEDRSTGTAVGDALDAQHNLDIMLMTHVAKRAWDVAEHRSRSGSPASGDVPVVLLGGWSGIWLHEALGHMLEADTFNAGPFGSVLGKRIAPEFINVIDSPGRSGFDDEGTPAKGTSLIEDGMLISVLTDRRQAFELGLPATGNGRRQDYRHAPMPRQWGVRLRDGESMDADLIAGIDTGVAVVSARSARVHPDGSFVIDGAAGFEVERGCMTRPIAGFSIEGDSRQSLSEIELVGGTSTDAQQSAQCHKRGQDVEVRIGSPGIRVRRLAVRPE